MTVTANQVAEALNAKKRGSYWIAKCPCHEDDKESLSIAVGDKRPVVVKCHAGCEPRLVFRKCLSMVNGSRVSTAPTNGARPALTVTQDKAVLKNSTKAPPKKKKAVVPAELVKRYTYRNRDGAPLYRKNRYEPKDFRIEHYDGSKWVFGRGDAEDVPYNLDKLDEVRGTKKAVFFVEGEKDADELDGRGFIATTTIATSQELTDETAEFFRDLNVVIIPDNDTPGIKAAHKRATALYGVAKTVRIVSPEELVEADKEDIYDFFNKYGGTADGLRAIVKETPLFKPKSGAVAEKSAELVDKKKKAETEDYFELFRGVFDEIKRDVFSGYAVTKHNGRWTPLLDTILFSKLRCIASDSGGYFAASRIEDAINAFTDTLEPELCVEIPKWDGRDRVTEIAKKVQWGNVSATEAAYFIKQWGSTATRRVMEPTRHRQRALVLQSASHNIGKDVLCSVLTGGAGQYAGEPALNPNNERDMFMALSDLMFAIVPEFDKLAKFHSGAVKDMITRNSAKCRLPYAKTMQDLALRTSFIGSCNTLDFYFDHTGAQRFVVLTITGEPGKAIDFSYPSSDSDKKQILAQFFEEAVEVDDDAEAVMNDFNQQMTPQDPALEMLEEFDEIVEAKKLELMRTDTRFTNGELTDEIAALARSYGFKPNKIRRLLKQSGRSWRSMAGRGYCTLDDVDADIPF